MTINLFETANKLAQHLFKQGIFFNQHGFPIIPSEMLLSDIPDEIVPFEHRNSCSNPKKTVLCYFENDELLYPRLKKIDHDIEICKDYMGVCGFDLSPRQGYDEKLQKFNIVLSQMVNAYKASFGIKFIPNFRTGDISTIQCLSVYPVGSNFAVGTLGCSRGYVEENRILLSAKLLYARPNHLLIYGPLRKEYEAILNEYGQPYTVYTDFQKKSRSRKKDMI